jgi:SAM-dependent methyltransferase
VDGAADDVTSLRGAWERNADDFARWVRTPGHDTYDRFHRDQFLTLLPAPGRAALDLGCGEGRLLRDLSGHGYRVAGVDSSPTMVRLAREADPASDVRVADGEALPFEDAAFDLVVAFMVLQDVDDLAAVVAEAARVLEPAGRLCVAIVHPLNSAGRFVSDDPDSLFTISGSYLASSRYADDAVQGGLRVRFEAAHRPLAAYAAALEQAGLLVEALREPAVPDEAATGGYRRWQRLPLFLHLRAVRPA